MHGGQLPERARHRKSIQVKSLERSIRCSLVLSGLLASHPAVGVALCFQEAAQAHRCPQETEGVHHLPTGFCTK